MAERRAGGPITCFLSDNLIHTQQNASYRRQQDRAGTRPRLFYIAMSVRDEFSAPTPLPARVVSAR